MPSVTRSTRKCAASAPARNLATEDTKRYKEELRALRVLCGAIPRADMKRYWIVAAIGLWIAALFISQPGAARADGPATPTPVSSSRQMSDPTNWVARPPDGPSQLDHGAVIYWMHCMVCHGAQGQGLTKFRSSFPPRDQNCRAHGCHDDPRVGAGFTFPDAPPIMGPGTLTGFHAAQDLYNFVSTRMPYQAPGTLASADYWAVVAYLLKKHDVTVTDLSPQNAQNTLVVPSKNPLVPWPWIAGAGLVLLAVLAFLWLRVKRIPRS